MEQIENYLGVNLFLDLVIFLIVLILPIPTTPLLIFFFVSRGLAEVTFLYLVASTVNTLLIYILGLSVSKLPFLRRFGYLLENKFGIKSLFQKIYQKVIPNEDKKINLYLVADNISYYDIAVARVIGVHNHFIMVTLGYLNVSPFKAVIVNAFFAIIDLAFYWIIIGTGSLLLASIFPKIDFISFVQSGEFTSSLFIITILSYLFFIAYKIIKMKYRSKKVS